MELFYLFLFFIKVTGIVGVMTDVICGALFAMRLLEFIMKVISTNYDILTA